MTASNLDWWRRQLPEDAQIIWSGQPYQGFFPPHVRWAYGILCVCLCLAWIASPWYAETVRDYWKIVGCTVLLAFYMWWDRFLRSRRVYVVTDNNVWWLSEVFPAKSLSIHPNLSFYRSGQNIVFSRLRFLVFEYLTDPDAALAALAKARESTS